MFPRDQIIEGKLMIVPIVADSSMMASGLREFQRRQRVYCIEMCSVPVVEGVWSIALGLLLIKLMIGLDD